MDRNVTPNGLANTRSQRSKRPVRPHSGARRIATRLTPCCDEAETGGDHVRAIRSLGLDDPAFELVGGVHELIVRRVLHQTVVHQRASHHAG